MNSFKRNIYRTVIEESIICEFRHLDNVQVTGVFPEVVTLQYIDSEGNPNTQTWTVGGTGETLSFTFTVLECVQESSVFVDGGTVTNIVWADEIECCI